MSVVLREKQAAHASVQHRLHAPVHSLLLHVPAAAAAFLAACAPIFSGMHPLGLCLVLAAPRGFSVSAALGAGIGYAVLENFIGIPYLFACVLTACVRLVLHFLHRTSRPLFAESAVCILFCILRSIFLFSESGSFSGVFYAAAESALILGAYCLLAGFFTLPFPLSAPDSTEKIFLCAAFCCGILMLSPYRFFELSPAHITADICILLIARHSAHNDAVCAAVCAACALCAADPFHLPAGFALAAGAVAAVAFSRMNRFAPALSFFTAGLIGVSCSPDPDAGTVLCIELALSAILYLLLPDTGTGSLNASEPQNGLSIRAERAALSAHLEAVSEALCFVGDTMRAVCDRLPLQHERSCELADTVAERCCKNCGKNLYCWVDCADETYEAFAKLSVHAKIPDALPATELPSVLQRRCQMPIRLTNAVNSVFAEQTARRVMRAESRRTRSALCEQYRAFSVLLADLSRQIYCTDLPDRHRSQKLEQRFRALGLDVLECTVTVDAADRISAGVALPLAPISDAELTRLAAEVSNVFRRSFSVQQCSHCGVSMQLSFMERPRLTAEYAVCSLPADGRVCADITQCFHDPLGKFHAVLCDGMGTGKAAAVGGTLCVRLMQELIHAGFCAQSAAKLVNVALTLKSDDENAVALDAFSVDLCSGDAVLYKAGGAASFLLRGTLIETYEADTLPIGILGTVTDHREKLHLMCGDTLVLVSDGVLGAGRDILFAEMLRAKDAPLDEFCRQCAHAAQMAGPEKSDDITVLAVRLCTASD